MISVERQVRTLLHAWPAPDRTERGEEILATTLDLVPSGRRCLPLAIAASLLFGGLRARSHKTRRNRMSWYERREKWANDLLEPAVIFGGVSSVVVAVLTDLEAARQNVLGGVGAVVALVGFWLLLQSALRGRLPWHWRSRPETRRPGGDYDA